jgi:hypothetical protein
VYRDTEWMAVLANLAFGRASLRVLHPSKSGFEGSGVGASRLTVMRASARGLGWRSHSSERGDVSSSWAPTAPGMVAAMLGMVA